MLFLWGRVHLLVNLAKHGRDGRTEERRVKGTESRRTLAARKHVIPPAGPVAVSLGQTPTFNDTPHGASSSIPQMRPAMVQRDRTGLVTSIRSLGVEIVGEIVPSVPSITLHDPYTSKASNCKRDESRNVYSAINLPVDAGTMCDVFFFFLFFLFFFSFASPPSRRRNNYK